jgi:predicted SAM-dependent methyltransferase
MNIIQRCISFASLLLQALGRRIWPIARKQIGQRLASIEHHIDSVEQQMPPLRAMVDSTIQRQIAETAQLSKGIDLLSERVEFVRREILYEMKFGRTTLERTQARILRPEKLAEARAKGLRLNLGCGHVMLPGYINVDQRDVPGVDIVADVGDLPLQESSVQELFSSHVLEHFPQEDLRRRLLPYWRSLLVSKGSFRAIVPDGEAMLAGLGNKTYAFEEFREVLFGAQDYDGDFHYNLFTPDSLRALVIEAGFVEIEVPTRGRRNGKCFEFEIRAKRA